MLIVETTKINKSVMKSVIGYVRFMSSCLPGDRARFEELHEKMTTHRNYDVCVVGFDIGSNQHYILMTNDQQRFLFGALVDDGCLEGIIESRSEAYPDGFEDE